MDWQFCDMNPGLAWKFKRGFWTSRGSGVSKQKRDSPFGHVLTHESPRASPPRDPHSQPRGLPHPRPSDPVPGLFPPEALTPASFLSKDPQIRILYHSIDINLDLWILISQHPKNTTFGFLLTVRPQYKVQKLPLAIPLQCSVLEFSNCHPPQRPQHLGAPSCRATESVLGPLLVDLPWCPLLLPCSLCPQLGREHGWGCSQEGKLHSYIIWTKVRPLPGGIKANHPSHHHLTATLSATMLASGLLLVALLACLTVLVLMSAWRQRKVWGKLPPGPTPLPFIGNYLQLNTEQMYNSLMKISERYGPVFTVHLGPRRIVVLCGHEAVKEALVDQAEEFSGRGEQATFDWLFKGYGVAFSNGERAKQLRRFSITTLRDFGVGKRGIEERIQEEAGFLVEALRGTRGAFIDPTFFLSRTVSNVISSIVFGDRFDYEDKEFLSLLRMMLGSFQFTATSRGQLYEMFYSVMNHLPGPQHQAFKELLGLEDFVTKKVEENQRTLDPNSPRHFIDSFLIRMREEGKNSNAEFNLKNLVLTTLNLFFAGTETVSTTLRYGFLLLMKHPDVEAKVHEEIDRVIGKNRQAKFEDRAEMPYTDAVIHEIQRFGDMIPMGLARRVTKDTKFRDFFLPKGTEVFPMLGSVLRDPKFFSNPQEFKPQHFLDEKGQFKKSDAFVPFSIGKRNCFGEGLARMELFLFLTTIMQNFRFKSPQSPRDIDISPKCVGFATIPRTYTMSFQPR